MVVRSSVLGGGLEIVALEASTLVVLGRGQEVIHQLAFSTGTWVVEVRSTDG
jgi:hypothetical protein